MSIACERDSCLIQKGSNMSSTAITFIIVRKDYKNLWNDLEYSYTYEFQQKLFNL